MLAVRRSLSLALLGLLALALTGAAEARIDRPAVAAPQGLRAFLLRTDEEPKHEFNRTPSFAWLPVRGALRYEFELATSRSFSESSIIWSNTNDELAETTGTTTAAGGAATATGSVAEKMKNLYANLKSPTVSIDVALPWITGSPYALYAHVRAHHEQRPHVRGASLSASTFAGRASRATSTASTPGSFAGRRSRAQRRTRSGSYGAKRTFMTTTNVADARDLYNFRRTDPFYTSSISFRVRAQRTLYGEVVSGLPVTSWGPWSPTYTDPQPPLSLGTLSIVATVSDVQSDAATDRPHALTPGFVFGGDSGGSMDYLGGAPAELFRVYVATDQDCVNIVYTGAVVGSPAYAPRTTGPLQLPPDSLGIEKARTKSLETGNEPPVLMVDGTISVTNETTAPAAGATPPAAGATPPAQEPAPATTVTAAKVDLPDTAWPTGGYYWTVVPVVPVPSSATWSRSRARRFRSSTARRSCRRTSASPAA